MVRGKKVFYKYETKKTFKDDGKSRKRVRMAIS